MAVTFTLVNTNDSTPANNQVVVAVTLQPAIEAGIHVALSSPDTDLTVGRTYVAAVSVTNPDTAALQAVSVGFGDVQGYEVRPITAPLWDADSGLVVTNTDWKPPVFQPYGHSVTLKHALQPGATAVYYVRIVRRSVGTEVGIPFALFGPCGFTGEIATLELSGDPTGEMWLLPADEDVNDHRPAASDEAYLEAGLGEDATATITMELPNGAPEGTYLVVQNAMGAFTGTGGYGLYLDLDANPELTYDHAVQYTPAFSGYEHVRDAVYRINQAIPPGTYTLQAVVRVNSIDPDLMAWDHDPLPMVPILSTTTDIIPAGVPDAILSVTFNTMSVLVNQGS